MKFFKRLLTPSSEKAEEKPSNQTPVINVTISMNTPAPRQLSTTMKETARRLFLADFLRPRNPTEVVTLKKWQEVLDIPGGKLVEEYLKKGYLINLSTAERMEKKFGASELREMLKARNLPTQRKKIDMIQALIVAAPQDMEKSVSDILLIQCTDAGREIAEAAVLNQKIEREDAERRVRELLEQKNFDGAFKEVVRFEKSRIWGRNIFEIDNNSKSSEIEELERIYHYTPQILSKMEKTKVDVLRIVAAQTALWGKADDKWILPGFETGIHLDPASAAQMILYHAYYQRELIQCRELNAKTVTFRTVNDTSVCPVCKELAGKKIPLSRAPELPNPKCTCEYGCRCFMSANF